MAQRRTQRNAQSQDLAPFVLAAGLPGVIVAEWYGFPGVPAAWLALLLAVMMMSQPTLTGPKDHSGYPVAANPAETRKLTRYRAGAEMRTAMFLPYRDLAPGRPIRASWISSVFLAVIAYLLPVIGNKHITPSSAHLANAIFALVLMLASTGSLRRARGQDNPGVRFDTWREFQKSRGVILIGLIAVIGLCVGGVLGVVLLAVDAKYGSGFGAHTLATPPAQNPGLVVTGNATVIVCLAVSGAWFGVLSTWRKSAMSGYVEMTNVRAQWNYRWTSLKYDITPVVVDHRVVDSHVTVDTLDAPGHLGAMEFIRNESRLAPLLAPGERVALLSVSDQAGRLGSRSAIRFLAVTWPQTYDVTSASADVELVTLWAQSGLAWVSRARGVHQEPLPESVVEVLDTTVDVDLDIDPMDNDVAAPAPHRHGLRQFWQQVKDSSPTTSTLEAALNQETTDPPVNDGEIIPTNSRLWRITWYYDASTIGPQLFRNDALDEIALALNTQVLIDHRDNGTMYIGHLDHDDIPDDIDHALTKVRTEDLWRRIWTTCVKSGANLPVPQLGSLGEESLENGSTVHRMAFVLNLGNEPLDYKYPGVESKLKSALGTGRTSGASFVAVTGHPDYKNGGRPGDRHPQVICVLWSFDPVPRTPTSLAPSGTSADEWVLAGLVNDAFSSLKLAHPEVAGVRCLTKRSARRHAWEVQLRLYGAVTTGAVRSAASKISEILAAPWVRVADAPDGCVLYLGDEPDDSDLASSRDAALVASLDWEQAFLVSHVVGSAGAVPILTSTSHMPSNPMVKVLEFELPPGLDKFTVKMAAGKLRTATGNVYLSVQDSDNGPTFLIIQASRENPLPVMVPFNFDAADTSVGMTFATGVDGEPIEFEPDRDIHLAIIGMTGSGKNQPLTERIPVPLSEKFPSGWATVGDLEVGDEVFAADGQPTKIVGLSPIADFETYTLHFGDGQIVNCGPDHLWKASSRSSRSAYSEALNDRRSKHFDQFNKRAESLRALATSVGPGVIASTKDISAISGEPTWTIEKVLPLHLSSRTLVPNRRSANRFNVADFIGEEQKIKLLNHEWTRNELVVRLSADEWLTTREITSSLLGRDGSREERNIVNTRINHRKPRSLEGSGCWWTDLYPVDETLTLLADHIESFAATGKNGRAVQPLERIVTASEMKASVGYNEFTNNWAVSVPEAIASVEQVLPLDPYVLGAWLGDGHSRQPAVTSADVELIDRIVTAGYPVTRIENRTDGGAASTYHFGHQLRLDLRACGYAVSDRRHIRGKFIPASYLRASHAQRLALLQGLMDTDGTVSTSGSCELCLCDETLIHDALELIRSLGIKASISSGEASITENDPERAGEKRRRVTGTRWRICFTTDVPVFLLRRKADRLPTEPRATQRWNYVTDIKVGEVVPMRCISVEHPEHLYLTDGFVPTHNSVAAQAILYGAAIKQYEVYVIDPTKAAADFRFLEPYARAMAVDVHSAAATLRAIYTEVERRKELNSRYAASSINDLPDDVRPSPILVFIDEFTSLIASEKVPSRSFDDADLERERIAQKRVSDDRMAIAIFTGKLAREARSAGVSLVLGTQKLMADSLKNVPNGGDLKTNLSRLLLGSTSQGERMSALRAFDQAPDPGEIVPKGRGIWESSVRTGVLMQGWFAPVSALGEALAERVDPLDLSDRLDLTGYFSAADTSTFMDTEEVIDLGEMEIDLTDFLDNETEIPADEPPPSAKRDAWQIDWSAPDGTHGETPAPIDEDDPFSKPAPRRRLTPRDDDDPFA